jgi:hypothetical protein
MDFKSVASILSFKLILKGEVRNKQHNIRVEIADVHHKTQKPTLGKLLSTELTWFIIMLLENRSTVDFHNLCLIFYEENRSTDTSQSRKWRILHHMLNTILMASGENLIMYIPQKDTENYCELWLWLRYINC